MKWKGTLKITSVTKFSISFNIGKFIVLRWEGSVFSSNTIIYQYFEQIPGNYLERKILTSSNLKFLSEYWYWYVTLDLVVSLFNGPKTERHTWRHFFQHQQIWANIRLSASVRCTIWKPLSSSFKNWNQQLWRR